MRAILVGVQTKNRNSLEVRQSLQEMEGLVFALKGKVLGKLSQKRETPEPSTYIGKGKAKQLAEVAEGIKADTIIFDTNLTPVQISNLEEITKCEVLDRTDLILRIFSERAKTKQAKLQVELATLQHELPRIYGTAGKHLSRIGGGYKTKGAGEKYGEIRVREIKRRITKIKKELKEIQKQRKEQRKWRKYNPNILKVALVGYTNVGKSTLLKRLTKRETFISDQLFATLDPKTSFIIFPDIDKKVLLTDTVGFVKNMPKEIMDAFMSTLEEVEEADLILHVVDVSDEKWQEKVEVVDEILKKIGTLDKPQVLVLNKVDKVINSPELLENSDEILLTSDKKSVIISTEKGWNLDKLFEILKEYAKTKTLSFKTSKEY
ncbi:MAG: GTPase HflX [Hydrogenothermus sp.]|nr:MAG: GTPase HflX [Hydrogenothermus sp.]